MRQVPTVTIHCSVLRNHTATTYHLLKISINEKWNYWSDELCYNIEQIYQATGVYRTTKGSQSIQGRYLIKSEATILRQFQTT